MNGKQAKKLRRIAMGLAVTLDGAGRKIDKNGYDIDKPTGSPSEGTIHNKRNTLRGIYRTIKKGVTSGKINS